MYQDFNRNDSPKADSQMIVNLTANLAFILLFFKRYLVRKPLFASPFSGRPHLIWLIFFLLPTDYLRAKQWTPVKREVLALWNSKDEDTDSPHVSYIHLKLETVFNHMGYKVRYLDFKKGVPKLLNSNAYLQQFAAIVTWFRDDESVPLKAYRHLLDKILHTPTKLIILGYIGVPNQDKKLNQLLKRFGVRFKDQFEDNPLLFEITYLDPLMLEFERTLFGEIPWFAGLASINKKNTVHLKIRNKAYPNIISHPVITTPKGGIILAPFDIFIHPKTGVSQWYVNPFAFIKKALGDTDLPIPDVSTLNNNRVFYSHIDGDGFSSIADVDRKSFNAQIWYDAIAQKYRLPTSVSIIEAEINPKYKGKASFVQLAQRIFKLPNVEVASHTFTHPLVWRHDGSLSERLAYGKDVKGALSAFKIKGYKIDYQRETMGSIDYINKHLAPAQKKVKILFWSGNCTPPEEAIQILNKNNILNINGGDTRFDHRFDSYSHVAPLSRPVGDSRQIYTSNANENLYTNLWHGPFSGFIDVIESFERTEKPFRMRPINLYYHFYQVEKISSLRVLHEVYKYIVKQPITPIYASRYVQMVNGYMQAQLYSSTKSQNRLMRYKITHHQPLRTFRFDNNRFYPDLLSSENVIGYSHFQGNLYIYAGNAPQTVITLAPTPPTIPYLSGANAWIDQLSADIEGIRVKGENLTPATIAIANLVPQVTFRLLSDNHTVKLLKVNDQGVLHIPLAGPSLFDLKLKLKID